METDTIKLMDMNENILKIISQESEKATWNRTKQQEIYQRYKYLGCPHRKILGTIFEGHQIRT